MTERHETLEEKVEAAREVEAAVIRGTTKKQSEFFAAVRSRGMLNTMLDGPVVAFELANPGMKARWEFFPPNGDNTLVVAREAMGFRLVDASELGTGTESSQKSGLVRRGDVVLMAGPEELVKLINEDDAQRAKEDWELPERSYRDHVRGLHVRRLDGTIEQGKPVGTTRLSIQEVPDLPEMRQHELAD